jgi:uncharacterized membrane protein
VRTAVLVAAVVAALTFGNSALAANTPEPDSSSSYKGLWIETPYPSLGVAVNESVELDLTLRNSGMPPQRVTLAAMDLPEEWNVLFLGDGRPVDSAFLGPDSDVDITLRVSPAQGVKPGAYQFRVAATSDGGSSFNLPIELKIGQALPARLALATELPALRGTPTSTFSYDVTLINESGKDAVARLDAAAPPGFRVTFKEGFGSQELTSIPVKPGEKRDLKVSVEPGQDVQAGTYQVGIQASTDESNAQLELVLDVTGRPVLALSGPDGRLSTEANAGKETQLALLVENTGSAPAREIKLSASQPGDWKVTFQPESIDELAPKQRQEVKAMLTPSSKAIAGDYMVTLRANGDGASESSEFRVTVETSTMWGVVGLVVIAASVVVLSLAVMRFGRR